MKLLRNICGRVRALFAKKEFDAEMAEEMREHLERRVEANVAAGMSAEDARYAAQRQFGGVDQLKERARAERPFVWFDQFGQDLRYAVRQLRRNPGFATTAILTLGLGIGGTTAMFSVVRGVLLKALPYEEAGQLVQLWEHRKPGDRNPASPGVFHDWRQQAQAFEGVAAFSETEMNFTSTAEPARLKGMKLSANGLQLLRAGPILGRTFAADEDQTGKDNVIVLTEELWQRLGGQPGILDTTVQLNGRAFTVIGILPVGFLPWEGIEFVVPFVFRPAEVEQRGSHFLGVLGRLKSGKTLPAAQAELDAIAQRLQPLFPDWKRGWGASVVPMREQLTSEVKLPLLILLGAVALVLVIACANVANLLMARASSRSREMAVRGALGAGSGRLVRQLLTESLLLSLLGAMAGMLVTWWSVGAISHLTTINLPRAQEVRLDGLVLGFSIAIAVLVGLAFGLAPAWQSARVNLNSALKAGGRGTLEGGRNRMRQSLIVAEVALALVLLVGAGLLLNSFWRLFSVSPGFRPQNVLTLQVLLSGPKYPDADRRSASLTQIVEKVAALPGVEGAAVSGSLPLSGSAYDTLVTINGRTDAPVGGFSVDFDICSPDYFRALGIPVRRGRVFDESDNTKKARVVVINEALARQLFPEQNPLGQSLTEGTNSWEIIGVVGDVRVRRLSREARPMMYRPQSFAGSGNFHLFVRTATEPLALGESVRRAILAFDPTQPVGHVRSMETVRATSVATPRLIAVLLATFAGTALLLAAIGLYGVISYHVAQRTHEIGVRMALGAARGDVLRMVLRQGMTLSLVGLAAGLLASLGLARVLANLLFEVKPADPVTLGAVSLLLLLVAGVACWLPARRATKVDPIVALRAE